MKHLALLPYLLCLALLAESIETDISVPGFPEMVRYFQATEAEIQLTMSVNFLGFCLAGLLLGPLSDSYGRRPVMVWGNVLFLICAIGTVTTTSLEGLIAWRFFQGMGATAVLTLFAAIIADAYDGEKASRLLARLNAVCTAAMAMAPLAGGLLVETLGWRSTYSFVALLCLVATVMLVLYLPETNHHKRPFHPKQILSNFRFLVTSHDFLALNLVPTLLCTGYMIYVASAVFFFIEQLNVSLSAFTMHQGCVVLGFSLTSFFGGGLISRIGAINSVIAGVILSTVGAVWLCVCAFFGVTLAFSFTVGMCLYAIGAALAFAPTFTGSMQVFPEMRGVAASIGMSLRLLVISLAIWAVGLLYDGTFVPIASLILASAVASSLLVGSILKRPHLSQLLA